MLSKEHCNILFLIMCFITQNLVQTDVLGIRYQSLKKVGKFSTFLFRNVCTPSLKIHKMNRTIVKVVLMSLTGSYSHFHDKTATLGNFCPGQLSHVGFLHPLAILTQTEFWPEQSSSMTWWQLPLTQLLPQ